ncbi:MAG: hypothetical protein CMJ86_03475 [Planctomycetes bacterium]|nr:hypothetical protein [Planctomycetota bacterium]
MLFHSLYAGVGLCKIHRSPAKRERIPLPEASGGIGLPHSLQDDSLLGVTSQPPGGMLDIEATNDPGRMPNGAFTLG